MKKFLYSLIFVFGVALMVAGTTIAFLSDTEASKDNVFTAGALDLKVDSEAHYRQLVCVDGFWADPGVTDCEDTTTIKTTKTNDFNGLLNPVLDCSTPHNNECVEQGFGYQIAKWEWDSGQHKYIPEGDAAGTNVTGTAKLAHWVSETEVDGVIRKAGTNYTVLAGGYTGEVEKYCGGCHCHDISHITFCGNDKPVCGNGIIEGSETCDDGNLISGDGCNEFCQDECSIYGTAEKTPDSATLDDGTDATDKVKSSDNIWAYQGVSGEKYIYLNWNFDNLPDDIPMTLANLTLEHRESDVYITVEWWDGAGWTEVCDPPEAGSDTFYTCDLLPYLDNTDKAKVIPIRLKLTRDGHCHEKLDWANLKLSWFKKQECGECGNCVLDPGEECDGNAGVPEGYICLAECKLMEKKPCVGQWQETDLLTGAHKFFSFSGLKPGDWGEDTVSLHVYDNDSWGRIKFSDILNAENGCAEPEYADEPNCNSDDIGELGDKLLFTAWLDEGQIPGFQNTGLTRDDPGFDAEEGDNIRQDNEPVIFSSTTLESLGGAFQLKDVLAENYGQNCTGFAEDGQNNNGECQGISSDGHLSGGTTYYIAIGWKLPDTPDNSTQSDTFSFDMSIEAAQYRHNPDGDF